MLRKQIAKHPGYWVSDSGQIFSAKGVLIKPLKPFINKRGYVTFSVSTHGKISTLYAHREVLLAFIGEPPGAKHECRHLDGIKTNNHVENLAWGTHAENGLDLRSHGTMKEVAQRLSRASGERIGKAKLTREKVEAIRLRFDRQQDKHALAEEFSVHPETIVRICRFEYWK